MSRPASIKLPTFKDERGYLTVWDNDIPFTPKRVFWIYSVSDGKERANHSHKDCQQAIFALRGSFVVKAGNREICLFNPKEGLYIPAGNHITLSNFSINAVCLVLASEHYDKGEILRPKTE